MFPVRQAHGVGLLLVAAVSLTSANLPPLPALEGPTAQPLSVSQPAVSPAEQQSPEAAIAADLRRVSAQVRVTCGAATSAAGRCVAVIDGQKLVYEPRPASTGGTTYVRTRAVVDLDRAQARVAREVAVQVGGKWRVRCRVAGGSRFYVVGVGRRFSCPIAGKDGRGVRRAGTIVYQVRDIRGAVGWESL